MKYLVQNKDALIRTIVALIIAIIQLLKVFGLEIGVTEDAVLSAVTIVIGAICWFYNNPTSKENCEHTGAMRLEKAQNKGIITGEDFTEEIEEEGEE